MQLNAIGVTTAEMRRTVQFYTILGLKFPELKETDGHIESIHEKAETKLMIDKKDIVREIIGKGPITSKSLGFCYRIRHHTRNRHIS